MKYIVEETLAGRADKIKGVAIAMSVFGRDESFDQQVDPIVRLEARRLRQDIDGYYAGPGRNDAIRISVPKGSYLPRFETATRQTVLPLEAEPEREGTFSPLRGKNRRWIAWVAGLAVIASVAVLLVLSGLHRDSTSLRKQGVPKGPIIVVLPFASISETPNFVAIGITHQVTTDLIRFRDLWVLPLSRVQTSQAEQNDQKTLTTELNADYALEGSVTVMGDRLRIAARLVDLKAGRYSWVRSYSVQNTPDEIYAVQDEITQDIVGNLAGKYRILNQDAMRVSARTPPESRSAYECVLEYYKYQIDIDLKRVNDVTACAERAVQEEPEYSEAWAVLSNLYQQKIRFALGKNTDDFLHKATYAAVRAVELDRSLAMAHLALANVRYLVGDIEGFRLEGETAIKLNPNDSVILAHYGMRLAFSGEWNEGLEIVNHAIALNPVGPEWFQFPMVFYLFDQGKYEEALDILNTIDMPNFIWTYLWRALLSSELGDHQAAKAARDQVLHLQPNITTNIVNMIGIWQLGSDFDERLKQSFSKAGLWDRSENGG